MSRLLLEADPVLKKIASPQAREFLRTLEVPSVEVPPGEFEPSALADAETLGLIVAAGLIARSVHVPGGASVELILPGQLLQPWTVEWPSFSEPTWRALEPVCCLLIDRRATLSLARFQPLLIELVSRGIRRAHTLTVSAAIESVVGIENRVLLALWHLAEECGTVTDQGVSMPLRLTHEMLAILVGSRRPSVSAALANLTEAGLVRRRDDRTWMLLGEAPAGPRSGQQSVVGQRR